MSKVEEVAAACRAAVEQAGKLERTVPFEEMSFLVARAAIEAMREPTGGMQADMRDAIEPYVQKGLSKPVRDQWQIGREVWDAGISQALNEEG